MTLDAHRRDVLLKTLRGRDFRRALKAIAELRAGHEPALADVVGQYRAPDEQREVQYGLARIVLRHGVRGLVERWPTPADAKWRANLVDEIGQFFHLWAEDALIDVMLAALEDGSREVRVKAVWALLGVGREEREREPVTSDTHGRALAALKTLRECMTPARRARATRTIIAMLEEHRQTPYPVLSQLVEILGYTATRNDRAAVEALEALRSQSGEPYHVSYERLDETKLDWRERLVAERKGIAPERLKLRIAYRSTGLLDQKLLAAALRRIQARGPIPD